MLKKILVKNFWLGNLFVRKFFGMILVRKSFRQEFFWNDFFFVGGGVSGGGDEKMGRNKMKVVLHL